MADANEIRTHDSLLIDLVSRTGAMEQAIKQAPTHEKLGVMFNEVRRDFGDRFSGLEKHISVLIEKQDATGRERQTASELRSTSATAAIAKAAAKEALEEQRKVEAEARTTVERSAADVDKQIRSANNRGIGGMIFGVLSLVYTIAKGQGWPVP